MVYCDSNYFIATVSPYLDVREGGRGKGGRGDDGDSNLDDCCLLL